MVKSVFTQRHLTFSTWSNSKDEEQHGEIHQEESNPPKIGVRDYRLIDLPMSSNVK